MSAFHTITVERQCGEIGEDVDCRPLKDFRQATSNASNTKLRLFLHPGPFFCRKHEIKNTRALDSNQPF